MSLILKGCPRCQGALEKTPEAITCINCGYEKIVEKEYVREVFIKGKQYGTREKAAKCQGIAI